MIKFKRDSFGGWVWEGKNRYGLPVMLCYFRGITGQAPKWYWEAQLTPSPQDPWRAKYVGRVRICGQAKTAKDAKAAVLVASGEIGVTT